MLEKRRKMKTAELYVLLAWLRGESALTDKDFHYDHLLNECTREEEVDVEFDFDGLVLDLFHIYDKLRKTKKEDLEEKLNSPMFNVLPKDIVDESMRNMETFIELYENIIFNTKFEDLNVKAIQKGMINEFIPKFAMSEEYEKCIELKQKLKEL